ncbi:VWA domain-containing protein [bacterium]|nr:VWA domain-containing protein [bacterium]
MATSVSTAGRTRDWLSRVWLVPSWLLSLCLHAAVLIGLATWMPYWQREPVGFSDEPSREIGIVLKSSGQAVQESTSQQTTDAIDPPPSEPVEATTTPPLERPTTAAPVTAAETTSTPPASVPLPALGMGASNGSNLPDPRDRIKAGTAPSVGASLGAAMPGAAFMGARDNGSRIMFVIDCSASMSNYGAMRSAKAALVSSLQSLSETQQFQVIFYSAKPRLMTPANGKTSQLMFATELNKTLARQQIAGVEPNDGTAHIPALELALRLNPEVIFFLTDADQPQLTPQELNSIQRLNQGRARIHTIEFGQGGEVDLDNFLKKLARQNGGTYRYFDIKRLNPE